MADLPTPTERTFRGQTAAQRVAGRRAALTSAAVDLIGTTGWSSATMTAICQRAGLTERYFYESFANRDALFVDLIEQVVRRIEHAVEVAASEPDGDRRVRARSLVDAFLAALLEDPRIGRVALLEGVEHAAVRHVRRAALNRLEALLEAHGNVLLREAPGNPALAAASLVGAALELVTRHLDGELSVTDEELAEHLVGLAVGWA